ncbi:MAG: hypothetical protein GY714_32385 [Desulfobacterales bacterium]|nr:hypothetical protein [Desulfobacterales bacterium]
MADHEVIRKLKEQFEGKQLNSGDIIYTIYYQKNPTFSFTTDSSSLVEIIQLFNIQANDMEEIFLYMQGEVWSPAGEARELIRALGLVHTSMSVGDVIRDYTNKKWYIVAPAGFEEVQVFLSGGKAFRVGASK